MSFSDERRRCAEAFVRHRRAELAARERARAAEQERVRALLPQAARLLRERYRAREVWAFGSTVHGRLDEHSDVDLAVRGLAGDYFRAYGDLWALFGRTPDLVPLERAAPSLVERVVREGVPL